MVIEQFLIFSETLNKMLSITLRLYPFSNERIFDTFKSASFTETFLGAIFCVSGDILKQFFMSDKLADEIENLKNSILSLRNSIDDLKGAIEVKSKTEINFDKLSDSIDSLRTAINHAAIK